MVKHYVGETIVAERSRCLRDEKPQKTDLGRQVVAKTASDLRWATFKANEVPPKRRRLNSSPRGAELAAQLPLALPCELETPERSDRRGRRSSSRRASLAREASSVSFAYNPFSLYPMSQNVCRRPQLWHNVQVGYIEQDWSKVAPRGTSPRCSPIQHKQPHSPLTTHSRATPHFLQRSTTCLTHTTTNDHVRRRQVERCSEYVFRVSTISLRY